MNFNQLTKVLSITTLIFVNIFHTNAQSLNSDIQTRSNYAAISTAFPFLRVQADARSGAMGEAGVAVSPDANALSINPSKLVFLENNSGVSMSYNPWFKNIVDDMNLTYLSGYLNDGIQAIGASVRYFSVGEVDYVNDQATTIGRLHPIEYALDVSYARRLGPGFSIASTLRFVQSRLELNEQQTGMAASGAALLVDISAYMASEKELFGNGTVISGGINISNLGPSLKDSYAERKAPMPANLRIGGAASTNLDDFSQLTFAVDLNKLLVPIYTSSFPASILNSFRDAAGGFKEELAEISISAGLEYCFQQKFALRTGYIYEHPDKGNRRYMSFGAGIKFEHWNADLAYIPTSIEKSAMANTLKISLMFNFGSHLATYR